MAVKFFSTEHKTGSGEGTIKINQVTKLNVIATPEEPHIVTIDRVFDNKFDKIPIEVLEMIGGEQGKIEVLAEFDNSDKTDFIENPYVEFDGTMHLKTEYVFNVDVVDENEGIYSFNLGKLSGFKKLVSIECK
ncbi:hypothetical protein [Tissierella sp.]|uniref:hypothetical protein n=1 Tax=Tissierella sp. TaxID=41274 RepID=UPI003032BD33